MEQRVNKHIAYLKNHVEFYVFFPRGTSNAVASISVCTDICRMCSMFRSEVEERPLHQLSSKLVRSSPKLSCHSYSYIPPLPHNLQFIDHN